MIKLFPAQLWTPDALKALKAVGRFGEVELLPSGAWVLLMGVDCSAFFCCTHVGGRVRVRVDCLCGSCCFASGGISPDNAFTWLGAGAACVGMGSCLVGDDVRVAPTADPAIMAKAVKKWVDGGRAAVVALFERLRAHA